jgi:hypothetical protein
MRKDVIIREAGPKKGQGSARRGCRDTGRIMARIGAALAVQTDVQGRNMPWMSGSRDDWKRGPILECTEGQEKMPISHPSKSCKFAIDDTVGSPRASWTTNVVLVLSTFLTVVTGYGLFFSPKNSWLIFASSSNRLRALRGKIEFAKVVPNTPVDEDKLARDSYAELQTILGDTNEAWLNLRMSSTPSMTANQAPAAP